MLVDHRDPPQPWTLYLPPSSWVVVECPLLQNLRKKANKHPQGINISQKKDFLSEIPVCLPHSFLGETLLMDGT